MSSTNRPLQDLTVKGESVERIYGYYREQRFVVNRRYQRKLVWTLEEKRKFINSILSGYPVPIILLAENRKGDRNLFEIIDGMQRLNAIMGFLENEYAVDGHWFDLNTMAETKAQLDAGTIRQQTPVLSRSECIRAASYTVPLSIYEFSDKSSVDEVFRRINSGGRQLSRQELRAAGSTGHFAQTVRKLANKVRGDTSAADELLLNDMKLISITNKDLSYGLDIDELFWVKQGVLTKEQVRQSRDEEIIADILAYLLLPTIPSSRSEFLDDYFGPDGNQPSRQRYEEIESAVQKQTAEIVTTDFQRVLDELKMTLTTSGKTFGQLLFGTQPKRAPRYFQVVYLAFHKLIVKEGLEVTDYGRLADLLAGSGGNVKVPEGGRWGSQDRERAVNGAAGIYSPAFGPAQHFDPARVRWITQLENILTQSYTEQGAYDFKQGFLRLDPTKSFDDGSFEKILKTLVAIANLRKGVRGYVLVGIADKPGAATRVHEIFGVAARPFERFYITGVEHEAQSLSKNLDQLFQMVTDRIRRSPISEPLRDYLARNVKMPRYYDKTVFILETQAQDLPSHYDGTYYLRHGNELTQVESASFGQFFTRYAAGY